jgi:hypothetical protein
MLLAYALRDQNDRDLKIQTKHTSQLLTINDNNSKKINEFACTQKG